MAKKSIKSIKVKSNAEAEVASDVVQNVEPEVASEVEKSVEPEITTEVEQSAEPEITTEVGVSDESAAVSEDAASVQGEEVAEKNDGFGAESKGFFAKAGEKIKLAALFVWKYLKIGGIAAWNYIKTRWVGFFLLWPVVILSLIVPFVYSNGFFDTEFESMTVFALPFIVILCFGLAFEKHSAKYAPIAMFVLTLITLLEFIRTAYMHLSTAFFGGISGNVFVQAGFPFSFCAIALVINILLCATAMFFKQYSGEKKDKAETVPPVALDETVLEVQDEQV